MSRHPKPTLEQNAGRLIRKAAKVLDDRGWVQGRIGTPETGMCVRGVLGFTATGVAGRFNQDALIAENFLREWLRDLGQADTFFGVPGWNDTPGRTKEEIVLHMNKFADEVDPQRP